MSTDLKKIVGQRLQLLRLNRHLTQDQMAEKLNLSTSAYCKIEYGETDLTLTRLNKIAEVLQMSAIDLFSKIDGDKTFDHSKDCNCCNSMSISTDSSLMQLDSDNNLRELIKANSLLIDMLAKRIDFLEKEVSR